MTLLGGWDNSTQTIVEASPHLSDLLQVFVIKKLVLILSKLENRPLILLEQAKVYVVYNWFYLFSLSIKRHLEYLVNASSNLRALSQGDSY